MEIEHDEARRDGFFFDEQTFRLDLYRLLSGFFASARYAKLARASDRDPAARLAQEFQETEITRLLVSVAATVRVIQDRERVPAELFSAACGDLWPDKALRTREALSLREACNKVIHARRFTFDASPLPPSERALPYPTHMLRAIVHLYGAHKRVSWKATLNVEQFVRASAALVRGLSDRADG